ncbi:DUF4153 domain-containing protein [Balneola sp. MJW-20]|uniref:DUF4153 domain-containing protein n=1 Tax=Gracilimonas aurantiaca TaxID=3234185 RepID=UPI0034653197
MKFSLPSLSDFLTSSRDSFLRFPLPILSALIGTSVAIWLAGLSYTQETEYGWLYNLSFTCSLGIPLLTGLKVLSESWSLDTTRSWLLRSGGVILLLLYYFTLSDNITEEPYLQLSRFFLYFIALHLFVAFAPFTRNKNVDEFWNMNKTLFLNILHSATYSATLFIGLAIALVSVDQLLEISVDDETYLQLWFFMVGIFNTWFFLSHFPKDFDSDVSVREYPSGLKIFAQYVLIPIVSVYILILYAYMTKIIIEWQWPNGWVANLVLIFSITGIFSLLLLYPFEKEDKNRWIRTYSKGYYFALIPLIVLLSLSIWTRISEYGITINRYYVVILALWLTGFVLYSLLSKKRNIKVIPVSLCITAMLISAGPWGAFSIAENSQKDRLEYYLDQYGYLDTSSRFIQGDQEIPFEDRGEISSIINYLVEYHGLKSFKEYFEQPVEDALKVIKEDSLIVVSNEEKIMRLLGIEYISSFSRSSVDDDQYYYIYLENQWAADISIYEQIISDIDINVLNSEVTVKDKSGRTWGILVNEDGNRLTIGLKESDHLIDISLTEFLEELAQRMQGTASNAMPFTLMNLPVEDEELSLMIIFHSLNATLGEDPKLNSTRIDLLIDLMED